jgi:hypothetical protein
MYTYNYKAEFFIVETTDNDDNKQRDSFATLEAARLYRDDRIKAGTLKSATISELLSTTV